MKMRPLVALVVLVVLCDLLKVQQHVCGDDENACA